MSSEPNPVQSTPRSTLQMLKEHPKGFWFIFWGEFAERCSFYGMRAILATYLADKIGMTPGESSLYMYYFLAACYFLPMLGGWIADNYTGKYWAIVGFSVPYIAGHFILGIEDKYYVISALCLLAMGTGVTKPNISSLMGMTYDDKRPGDDLLRSNAFALFYMAINIGAFISQFTMPIIKREFSYQTAFAFPTILMAIALVLFALGKKHYVNEAEYNRKRKDAGIPKPTWAERLKVTYRIGGLFLLVSCFWAIFDQQSASWIFFGRDYMINFSVFGLEIDPEQMQSLNSLLIILFVPFVTAFWNRQANRGRPVSPTTKIIIGFMFTAASMGVMFFASTLAGAGKPVLAKRVDVETKVQKNGKEVTYKKVVYETVVELPADGKVTPELEKRMEEEKLIRRQELQEAEKVSLLWQVGCYIMITLAEILISITGLELAFVAAPPSMKGYVTALWLASVGIGNLFINAPLSTVYDWMSPGSYFLLLVVLMLIVTVAFLFVGRWFNRVTEADRRLAEAKG